jgi:predicted nucleotidyltransferase
LRRFAFFALPVYGGAGFAVYSCEMTGIGGVTSWKQWYAEILDRVLVECQGFHGDRLISFCVFGSVGRDTMRYDSDIDLLIVVAKPPIGRVKRVREFHKVELKLARTLAEARRQGVCADLSPVIKSPEEVRQGSLLFLDIIEDGRILFDRDGFLGEYLAGFKRRLDDLGARRIRKGDAWYWILKEKYTPGEEFSI